MPHDVEVRKTVTVIFTDVAEWTSLGEDLDPEALRHVMSRYFAEMRSVIERHGGRVEKFIGDAVMAVFGIPTVREDDALRAVRAAEEMRTRLDALNVDLDRDHRVTIQIRTGVNTGEVVVGVDLSEVLATGQPVIVAARLEQLASAGEILIGEPTLQLVRDAVDVENVGPLTLKGKTVPLGVWRLVNVSPEAPGIARSLTSPMVGRAEELSRLHQAFAEASERNTCRAVTVVAEAGVGKSRLMAEFATSLEHTATMTRGRCLPYGDGITFWPIAEVVRQLAGIDGRDQADVARSKIEALLDAESDAATITDHVAAVMGLADVAYPVQETFWAIRRVLEAAASPRSLVVGFDDIHWAEPTFLDLLEYLWGWSTTSPILIVCSARPELLEARAGWGEGIVETIRLDPLSPQESDVVIEHLLDGGGLDAGLRARISDVTEGNPLFVEEMLRMLADEGLVRTTGEGSPTAPDLNTLGIPPTISALLDARLAGLPPEERSVLQRASVMGRLFSWTGVLELSPVEEQPVVGRALQSLVRRGMIHPGQAEFAGDDGFTFSHVLVRDAAYRSVPKETRAVLHERFARWVEARRMDGSDMYEEIIGYHLEQAFCYHAELGSVGASDRQLAEQGAGYLISAGLHAFARNDVPATVNLLSRAVDLLPEDSARRVRILPELGDAYAEAGDLEQARRVMTEAQASSAAMGDPAMQAHAMLLSWLALGESEEADVAAVRLAAEKAFDVFADVGDERGMCRALRVVGDLDYRAGHIADRTRLMERALVHARNAGDAREEYSIYFALCVDLNLGPTPAPEAIRRCEELLEEEGDKRVITGAVFHALAHLRSMTGEIDEAVRCSEKFRTMLWDSGAIADYWFFAEVPFNIKMLSGEPDEAIAILTEAIERLEQLGGEPELMLIAMLSQALYVAGRHDEARRCAEQAVGCVFPISQRLAQGVLAMVMAADGEVLEAERLARDAVSFFTESDLVLDHAMALTSLGEVLRLAGRPTDAAATVEQAMDLYVRKGDVVSARRARTLRDQLATAAPA